MEAAGAGVDPHRRRAAARRHVPPAQVVRHEPDRCRRVRDEGDSDQAQVSGHQLLLWKNFGRNRSGPV